MQAPYANWWGNLSHESHIRESQLPLEHAQSAPRPALALPQAVFARSTWSDVALASVAALICMLVLALAYTRAWPLTLDIGGRDARFVSGFHEPETSNGIVYRWTTSAASIALPRPPTGAALLTVRILNSYPAEQPDPQLTLSADNQPLAVFAATRQTSGMRLYRVLVPTNERLDWALRLGLHSTTYTPTNDPRPLGVVLDWASLQPMRTTLLPPLWMLFWSAALGAVGYALVRRLGTGHIPACVAAILIGLLITTATLARPLEVLPFVHRLAGLLATGWCGITLARLIAPPNIRNGALAIRGIHLPIYLAVAWWMLPVFQVIQRLDGAAIGLGDETLWIGGILGLVLAIGAGILALWRKTGERRTSITRFAYGALAVGAIVHLIYMLSYAFTRTAKDFWILFKGARDWVQGGSLYDMQAVLTNHMGAVFKVPPFYGMLFTPFVFQDGLQIIFYHRIINLVLIALTAIMILLIWRPRPLWWGIAFLPILFNSRPLADTVAYGQIDLMLLFLLTCALWALRRAATLETQAPGTRPLLYQILAGALVALGTLFKIYPVILLAFFVIKRRWFGLIGFGLGMLLYNGLAIAIMGWEMHRTYLFDVIPNIGGTTSWVENQTISGFLARLVDVPFDAHIFQNRAVALFAMLISGFISLLVCVLALWPARGDSSTFALQYSLFLLLMVLAVPAAWMHYETLLVLPFAALVMHLREQNIGLLRAALLAIGFALVSYGNQWSFNGTTVMGILTIAGVSYKFYGMLLLGGLLAGAILEQPAPIALPRIRRNTLQATGAQEV